MHCSSSEAAAQLVRLGRERLSFPPLVLRLRGNPFPSKNGAVGLNLTLLGVGSWLVVG